MVQNQPQKYKLEGADKLRFSLNMEKTDARFNAIESLLSDLAVKTS
jgi:transcription-repair coupling factor (superfamily II helicase)